MKTNAQDEVTEVTKATKGIKGTRATKGIEVTMEMPVQLEERERLALMESPGPWARQDQQGQSDRLETLEPLAQAQFRSTTRCSWMHSLATM